MYSDLLINICTCFFILCPCVSDSTGTGSSRTTRLSGTVHGGQSETHLGILGCIKHGAALGVCSVNTEILVNAIKERFPSKPGKTHSAFIFVDAAHILDGRKLWFWSDISENGIFRAECHTN